MMRRMQEEVLRWLVVMVVMVVMMWTGMPTVRSTQFVDEISKEVVMGGPRDPGDPGLQAEVRYIDTGMVQRQGDWIFALVAGGGVWGRHMGDVHPWSVTVRRKKQKKRGGWEYETTWRKDILDTLQNPAYGRAKSGTEKQWLPVKDLKDAPFKLPYLDQYSKWMVENHETFRLGLQWMESDFRHWIIWVEGTKQYKDSLKYYPPWCVKVRQIHIIDPWKFYLTWEGEVNLEWIPEAEKGKDKKEAFLKQFKGEGIKSDENKEKHTEEMNGKETSEGDQIKLESDSIDTNSDPEKDTRALLAKEKKRDKLNVVKNLIPNLKKKP